MSGTNSSKTGGYLFMASGIAFFAAAIFGEQQAFYGVGAMFICLGVAFVSKAKPSGRNRASNS